MSKSTETELICKTYGLLHYNIRNLAHHPGEMLTTKQDSRE